KRGQYGDADYKQISGQLQGYTAAYLKDKKTKWHRKCYGATCHSGYLERARVRYQKACQHGESQHLQKRRGRPSAAASVPDSAVSETPYYTHLATSPFNANLYFFCQGDRKEPVYELCTFSAGKQLQKAVDVSKKQTWKAGEVLNMTDLKSAYSSMFEYNGVHIKPSTQDIKENITSHINDVHFTKAKWCNESDRVFTTAVQDATMEDTMVKTTESYMRQLFKNATALQAANTARNKHPWEFKEELSNDDAE
ncbi:hypothetical protein SK128_026935, partial [Halocaridina rubra]